MSVTIVKYDKLTAECRGCKRLTYNGGSCGGRDGIVNICLVYEPMETIVNQNENTKLKKAFALACRCVAEHLDCPAAVADVADSPECNEEKCGDMEIWECWQRYFIERAESEQVCRVCGCTWTHACEGGCYWVEEDLCSQCVGK